MNTKARRKISRIPSHSVILHGQSAFIKGDISLPIAPALRALFAVAVLLIPFATLHAQGSRQTACTISEVRSCRPLTYILSGTGIGTETQE